MNKQGPNAITWTDYTWNPITGCRNGCSWCYARKIAHRFKRSFDPVFHEEKLVEVVRSRAPSGTKIFVCSTGDIMCGNPQDVQKIINVMDARPDLIFQVLTKLPIQLRRFEWPENVWLGTSVDSIGNAWRLRGLLDYLCPNKKWLAVCPALTADPEHMGVASLRNLDWLVLEPLHHSTQRIRRRSEDLVRYWIQRWKQGFSRVPLWVKGMINSWENSPTMWPRGVQ